MPKISVVMPVYNGEKYLKEAIDSILNQTFSDFEFIIIDDGSTDNTESIIKSYSDRRIRYIKNEKNLGVAESLNKGLDMAQGEYIARMDADDISMPKRFEKQVKYMDRHKNLVVCGCRVEMFGAVRNKDVCTILDTENIKINMLFASCLAHPTVMMRKSVIDFENYRYDRKYEKVEDYELWTRIIFKYDINNINEMLLKYRIHTDQVTQSYVQADKKKYAKILHNILENLSITDVSEDELSAYICYATGEFDCANQLLPLVTIFNKIVIKNEQVHFCDSNKLKKYFISIIMSLYDRQNEIEVSIIISKRGLVKKKDFVKNNLKRMAKNCLKRKDI